jgi:hypothetical protein
MIQSDQPEIITLVAWPSGDIKGDIKRDIKAKSDNVFIDAVLDTLASKGMTTHRIIKVSSVRDIDVALSNILLNPKFKGKIRLQIIGHGLAGVLALGALWIPDEEIQEKAFAYPFYVLDTNPAALGLLAKFAGKIAMVTLVSCNIGSSSSFGYAINGRTLTYTLAELLQCVVLGADDVVAPNEFDARGRYEPSEHRRKPKGWRWVRDRPPMWIEAGVDP